MKSINLRLVITTTTWAFLLGATHVALADSTDNLLKKLRDKGVLTDQEYDEFNASRDTEKIQKSQGISASFHDGINFESADKTFLMQINGRIQLDGRYYGKNDSQNLDQVDVRRAYLGVKGKIYNDYEYNVTTDLAQGQSGATTGTSQLDVAYFGINWWSQAKFRFGQFDMPFGLEHLTSDLYVDFQERSFTDQLAPGKERGAMVHGAPINGVYYGLAVSTGRGKNVSDKDQNVEGVDVIGRLTANLATLAGLTDNTVLHVGGDFSHGYVSQNQAFNGSTIGAGNFKPAGQSLGVTEGRGITFFTPTAFSSTLTTNDVERTRLGLEGAVAYGPVKLQSEWARHNYSGLASTKVNGTTSFDKDIDAWYVAANWMVTGEPYAATYADGLWGRIHPTSDFVHPGMGSGLGAIQLNIRYSEFDGSDFANGNGPGSVAKGTPTGAHAWTAGVTWFLNPQVRLMANYVGTKFEDGVVTVKNVTGTSVGTTDNERAMIVRGVLDF